MQSLAAAVRPRFVQLLNRPSLKPLSLRAFSSSSSDYANQSRGGLPRFFSQVLPPSKAVLVSPLLHSISIHIYMPLAIGLVALLRTLKGGRADWLVEKCTELGAQSVTPLLTERSPSISENRTYSDNGFLSCNFYYGFIANSAFVYGGQRLHEMVLNPPMKIDGLLPLVSQSKLAFVAIAEATPLVTALSSSRNESSGLIIVGPEGDFTEKEVNKIVEAGATAVGLGPHRLRVETATIALLATLMLCSDSQQMPIP
ncbi:16S rRNA (uracil(1498)-N(3))-methyltransferase [Citrus sinensis]|uniref:16S rRNA (Uracil(1498)-N(3))-methyltransferase n=1 Tax=Citrus sinensis TaxID=2711 RepID=A0ACB8IDG9_CITSI|nr:16S rRNA (uracil(1498)-N(3))-methyltransferase [Citrus sinensis]